MLRQAANALLPQNCLLCQADSGNQLLCPACRDTLPQLAAAGCPTCAAPTARGETCGACLKNPPHFDATIAAFAYAFPMDKLVQQLKYAHRLAIADFFAGELLARKLPAVDLIVPLPLSPRRLRERGFNQAAEIARPMAGALGLPLLLDGCRRILDTAPQAMLPWKERRKNVRHAFACGLDLTGKSVLVVDDVMTTGATLDEFARLLKNHGAARVCNAVVARTVRD
ncbi:MAG: ComF family protein [Gammaproteobacteria bacterium]|nr:ComF family protein [Gammaproteobacteria bacterium]MBU1645909.1 ComF family protein [Gammaproteobacteria bacterium]MBU1971971.1 ComF family protein [Gammaproteobacteria bacterium]